MRTDSRLEDRLKRAIDEKKFYEAHQLYKTLAYRHINRGSCKDGFSIMQQGADYLLSNFQYSSGTDLAILSLKLHEKHKCKLDNVDSLCSLFFKMDPSSDERMVFLKQALDLMDAKSLNTFNYNLAQIFWVETSAAKAKEFLFAINNGYIFGNFLVHFHLIYGTAYEIDMILTQAILQSLCLKHYEKAEISFYTYIKKHPHLNEGPPFSDYPLLNFIWLLMLAIRNQYRASVFQVLCQQYRKHLQRDVEYSSYLKKIGSIYFQIQVPSSQPPNLLNNLFGMLTGSADNAVVSGSSGGNPFNPQNIFAGLLDNLNEPDINSNSFADMRCLEEDIE